MFPTTIDAIKAILLTDPTVTPADRQDIMVAIRNHGRKTNKAEPSEQRILRRAEVAKMLGCSLRTVDNIARQGVIRKITLPNRKRAWGFRLNDVERLINAEIQEPDC